LREVLPLPRADWPEAHFDERLANVESLLEDTVELPAFLAGCRQRAPQDGSWDGATSLTQAGIP
jgi:hypothetical protein